MSLITPAVYKEHDAACTLGDDALQRIIDANESLMIRRLGPHAQAGSNAVERFEGGQRTALLQQPAASIVQVRERRGFWQSSAWVVLGTDDWLLENGGLTLRRLAGGTNSWYVWGAEIEVTYVPMANIAERVVALIDLCSLDVSGGASGSMSGGLTSRTMGSWSESYGSGGGTSGTVKSKKNAVLASLSKTGGLAIA